MAQLVADTWLSDLETALANHIKTYMASKSKTVLVHIGEVELPRPLVSPHIVIQTSDDVATHVGGLDIVSNTEQADKHNQRFYLSIITDDDCGAKKERALLSAILTTYVLGARKPTLLSTINGMELTYIFEGNEIQSGVTDQTQYIATYCITITVIVPYTSLIL